MRAYKEKEFLIFELEDGSIVKYNLATKESIGKRGKPVKNICSQLRGYDIIEVINSFEDKNYKEFLSFIEKQVNRSKNYMNRAYNYRVMHVYNVGSFLNKIKEYSLFEQYFSAGIYNLDYSLEYNIKEIPKGLLNILKENKDMKVTNILIKSYKANPNLFNNIYKLMNNISINKDYMFTVLKILHMLDNSTETKDLKNTEKEFYKCKAMHRLYDVDNFIELVINHKYDIITLIKYIDQLLVFEGLSPINSTRFLKDYLVMQSKMTNTYNKYPKNLLTVHHITVKNFNKFKEEYDESQFRNAYKNMTEKEFEYNNFIIKMPNNVQEIRNEGINLNHCVYSYVNRILEGRCHIMFLRLKNSPEDSLVTLEIIDNKVVQAKGNYNRSVTEKEKEVIKRYEEYLLNKTNK